MKKLMAFDLGYTLEHKNFCLCTYSRAIDMYF